MRSASHRSREKFVAAGTPRPARGTRALPGGAPQRRPISGGGGWARALEARMQKKLFSELGLSPELLKAVAKMGFEEASPIQSETIPLLLERKDVVGLSQTGSGKTAAFAIPAIEKVDANLRAPQVLILC